jgi:hypothetical protein
MSAEEIRKMITLLEGITRVEETTEKPALHNKFWINIRDGRMIKCDPEHNRFVLANQDLFGVDFTSLIPEKIRTKIESGKGSYPANWFALITKELGERGWVRAYYGSRKKEISIDALTMRDAHKGARILADMFGDVRIISIDLEQPHQVKQIHGKLADQVYFMIDNPETIERFIKTGRYNPPWLSEDLWHGSPHRVDQFSTSKIGSGEGNQHYGWGLYFATAKEVAEYYRDEVYDMDALAAINKKMGDLVREMRKYEKGYRQYSDPRGYELAAEYDRLMDERANMQKYLYHVNLPDSEDFLYWNDPLDKQSCFDKVTDLLHQHGITRIGFSATGEDAYNALSKAVGSDKAASLALLDVGVPGIKYLDAISRGFGRGTYNYVIFDDQHIKINKVETNRV